MAVVELKSTLYRTPDGPTTIDHLMPRGRVTRATGQIANAATDSALSKYLLHEVPSHCILGPATVFDVEDWGFATVSIGTFGDPDAWFSVAQSAGDVIQPITPAVSALGERAWQTLGLAADPGGMIGIYAHAPANAVAAGDMKFVIEKIDNV